MRKIIYLMKKSIKKSNDLAEAIAVVWGTPRFFIKNPENGRILVDTLYYVECWSAGSDDYIPPEKIGSPEWNYLKSCLQDFCNYYRIRDWVGYEYPLIILDQMNRCPRQIQLCSIYTALLNIWTWVYADKITYRLLEATALLGCLDSYYIAYIYSRIGIKN